MNRRLGWLALAAVPAGLVLWDTWTLAPGSRLAPLWVLLPTLALSGVLAVRGTRIGPTTVDVDDGSSPPTTVIAPFRLAPQGRTREIRLLTWLLALGALVVLFGFPVAVPIFLAPYLRIETGLSWKRAWLAAGTVTALFLLFSATMLQGTLPRGLLGL